MHHWVVLLGHLMIFSGTMRYRSMNAWYLISREVDRRIHGKSVRWWFWMLVNTRWVEGVCALNGDMRLLDKVRVKLGYMRKCRGCL